MTTIKHDDELTFGFLLPSREQITAGTVDARALLDLGARAEEVGFDSLWLGDSPLARPRFEPLVMLGALAARTSRVRLGTAVLLAALRPPIVLAQSLATLDRLSGGRLTVAFGAGFPTDATKTEFSAVGVPPGERIGRMMETVEICRTLWRADRPVSHTGKYWSWHDVSLEPKPVQPGGPPLWFGGSSAAALRRVGSTFDGWLPCSPGTDRYVADRGTVQSAAASASRPDGSVSRGLYATVALHSDPAAGKEILESYVRSSYGAGLAEMSAIQAYFAGTPRGCAEWLRGYIDAGARHIVLRCGTGDPSTPMMEMLAAEVLPALRRQRPTTVAG